MFDKLASFENLLSACRKAAKNCRKTQEITKFFFNLEKEIFTLQTEIMNGTYNPCPYQYFIIHDPKKRQIAVASFKDRIVHHAVVNILEPLFEKSFIFDSYASRKFKGTHKAIIKTQKFIGQKNHNNMLVFVDAIWAEIDCRISVHFQAISGYVSTLVLVEFAGTIFGSIGTFNEMFQGGLQAARLRQWFLQHPGITGSPLLFIHHWVQQQSAGLY